MREYDVITTIFFGYVFYSVLGSDSLQVRCYENPEWAVSAQDSFECCLKLRCYFVHSKD